jgi:type I restriction enzyme, S subunit
MLNRASCAESQGMDCSARWRGRRLSREMRDSQDALIAVLQYLLSGIEEHLLDLTEESGHGTKTMPTDKFAVLQIAFPSINEQMDIIVFYKEATRRYAETIGVIKNKYSSWQNTRGALISSAVTGKIKV